MKDDSLLITQAQFDDLDDVAALFDAYRTFYGKESDLDGARAFIRERMALRESVIFLARDARHGTAAGFTQLYPIFTSTQMRRAWLLNDLYVDAGHRRRGVGAALLSRAHRHGEDTGAAYLLLETAHDNSHAQKLYEAQGWEPYEGTRFYSLTV